MSLTSEVERSSDPGPTDAVPEVPAAVPRWYDRRWPAYGLLTIAALFVSVIYWPGHMSGDSFALYAQAIGDDPIADWHSPILVMLWRIPSTVYQGVAPILVAGVLAMAFGLYGVLRLGMPRLVAAPVAAALLVFPPVLSFVGVISRDVWFVDLLLGSVVALRLAHERRQRAWLVVAGVLLWLALTARQNGVFTIIVLAAALLAVNRWIGRTTHRPRHARGSRPVDGAVQSSSTLRRLGRGVGVLAAPFVLTAGFVLSQQLIIAVAPVQTLHPEQAVYLYDLLALSVREDELLVGPDVFPSQDLALLEARWNPNDLGGLIFSADAPVRFWLGPETVAELRDDWLDAVTTYPDDWAAIRFDVFRRQSGIGQPSLWVHHPGIDPNTYGMRIRFEDAHDLLVGYLDPFIEDENGSNNGDALFLPYPYALAGLVAAVAAWPRRRRWRAALGGWLGAAVVVYALTPLAPTTGAVYRYSYFTVVGGAVCAALVLAAAVAAVIDRRHRPGGLDATR